MKAFHLQIGDVVRYKNTTGPFMDMRVKDKVDNVFTLQRPYISLSGPVPLAAIEECVFHETSNMEFVLVERRQLCKS